MAETSVVVTGGVDTHLDTNMAAALDGIGGQLGVREFPIDSRRLPGAAGLAAQLRHRRARRRGGHRLLRSRASAATSQPRASSVIEVDRPNRQNRRRRGKSDRVDALSAARAALSGDASGQAKARDGAVEAIRVLRVARSSARHDRNEALNQMRSLVSTAPDELRQSLRGLSIRNLVDTAAALRPSTEVTVVSATKTSLRELARRALLLAVLRIT